MVGDKLNHFYRSCMQTAIFASAKVFFLSHKVNSCC